jgi:hypothetical protein
VYIKENTSGKLVEVEIALIHKNETPLKKDGWNFNWRKISTQISVSIYAVRKVNNSKTLEGVIALKIEEEMLVMDVLELAPYNIGKNKQYEDVAGLLIAFACKESLKIKGNYKGFVTFVSKTRLISWYQKKYGAEIALGQRMFIDWHTGTQLIKKYINRIDDENK